MIFGFFLFQYPSTPGSYPYGHSLSLPDVRPIAAEDRTFRGLEDGDDEDHEGDEDPEGRVVQERHQRASLSASAMAAPVSCGVGRTPTSRSAEIGRAHV